MKKTSIVLCMILTVCSTVISPIHAKKLEDIETSGENIRWTENNPNIAIFDDPLGENLYKIEYNNVWEEPIKKGNDLLFLMIDGGFVLNSGIKTINNRTYIPIETFSKVYEVEVEYSDTAETLKTTYNGTEICFYFENNEVQVNGTDKSIDSPIVILDSSIYVPLRFIAETLGADVQFVLSLDYENDAEMYGTLIQERQNVSVVIIERPASFEKKYTVEEGLAEVKKASLHTYEELIESLKVIGNSFNDSQKDYDPNAVYYTNFDLGRFYIYKLEGFEEYPILFNKYTGEIYSEHAGLPFTNISKGFINISWMYQ